MARQGISGLAVTLAAAGGYLVYAGIRNVPLIEGLRDLAGGRLPPGRPPAPTRVVFGQAAAQAGAAAAAAAGSSGFGSRIEAAGRQYLGRVPYLWGGHTPAGWDCSGFVTWVLHHDLGIDLTRWKAFGRRLSNTHTVSAAWMVTDAATTVPRDQTTSGDLLCWAGHIGIAVDHELMINAAGVGKGTREQRIWGNPVVRRLKV